MLPLKKIFAFLLIMLASAILADAQRFIQYDPPLAGPRKTLRYNVGDEITLQLKDDESGFYTGYITSIEDSLFYVNRMPVKPHDVDKLRIRRSKAKAIIPRILGWGAQLYLAVRLINSAINHNDPIITPIEIGILTPIIVAYYVYEFAINTRKREYKVTAGRPIKIIILKIE